MCFPTLLGVGIHFADGSLFSCRQGAFDHFDSDDDGMLVGSEIIEVPKG